MKTICVMSRKGGAGKTTVAFNLAVQAHVAGSSVMLVDCDPQRSASTCLKARQTDGPRLIEAAAGKIFNIVRAAEREGFDLVIIDTPAAPEVDVAQAANCADVSLVVSRPTYLDILAVAHSSALLRQLGRSGAICLNQTPPSRSDLPSPTVRRALEALAAIRLPVAGLIGSRLACQQSLALGRSAAEQGCGPAAAEFEALGRFLHAAMEHKPGSGLASSEAGPSKPFESSNGSP